MHRRSPGRLLGVAVACLLLTAACGDDGGGDAESFDQPDGGSGDSSADGEESGGDEQEACDLLTTDEVAELLGQAVEDGEQDDFDEGVTRCQWPTEELSQVVDAPITLSLELGPLTDEESGEIDEALATEANEPLDIGDQAVLVCGLGADGEDCNSFDEVIVAVGDQYLEVDLGNWGYPGDFTEDEAVQITEEAARRAVDALA